MKIAMLLDGAITHDHRVIKMIQTISSVHEVDLFCLSDGKEVDQLNFNSSVRVFPTKHKVSIGIQFLRHSFFCYEFAFFYKKIMNTGVKYDYVWANDLPTLMPAEASAHKLSAKLIYDAHEIYIETLNQFFPAKAGWFKTFLFDRLKKIMKNHGRRVEKKFIQKAHVFVTVNESLLTYFQKEYFVKNGHVIMNLPRQEEKQVSKCDLKREFGFAEKDKVLLYQGNLNQGRGLELLVEASNSFPLNWKLVIIGNGTLKETLKMKSDPEKVKFIDYVPITDLASYTAGADVGVNLLEEINLSKKMASPNKLFEYIHAGIPVLASKGMENQKVVEKFDVGILCELNVSSILSSLHQFDDIAISHFSLNCKKAQTELKWQNQENEILSLFS
jgi:glycosyltransferase involved in cell wall biosynthesis